MSAELGQISGAARLELLAHDVLEAQFVDKARQRLFAKLGIHSIFDLLHHLPFRYLDLRVSSSIAQAPLGEGSYVGTIHSVVVKRVRPRLNVTEISIVDGTGTLVCSWFNQPWLSRQYVSGDRVVVSGVVKHEYGMLQMRTPFIEKIGDKLSGTRILPVYPSTEGLSQGWLRKIIARALDDFSIQVEYLPQDLVLKHRLLSFSKALQAIHYPKNLHEVEVARRRLAYNEILEFELAVLKRRYEETNLRQGIAHRTDGELLGKLPSKLEFELNHEQKEVVKEILEDMASPHPMRRILIGDVGTGKTVIALHAIVAAIDSGYQAAMMAPTEVLALQYDKRVTPTLEKLGIRAALLTGSTKASKRKEILEGLKSGEIDVAFGTHALLEKDIEFRELSLAIIDEQHRFGVAQRNRLRAKGERADLLAMTATPIPRSLAQTAFGDMLSSYLHERPTKGAGFSTKLLKVHQAFRAYDEVLKAAKRGEQAYVITALVDESDSIEAAAAMKVAEELASGVFSKLRVGLLTGRMKPQDKQEVMRKFEAQQYDVLVSTTVVEVGVDVANATQMIILNAERYGVAQLHQLRGRVGRKDKPGQVFLISDSFSEEATKRFEILLATDDGFKLAEFDLEMRGPGDILGTQQSGILDFKVADIVQDAVLISAARQDAKEIIAHDPSLKSDEMLLFKPFVMKRYDSFAKWEQD